MVVAVGKVGSKKPCEFECFRIWPLLNSTPNAFVGAVTGDAVRSGESLVAYVVVGREKFCKLVVLEFGCEVVMAPGDRCACTFWARLVVDRGDSESLYEESTRRTPGL
jgi:hypothetical protein